MTNVEFTLAVKEARRTGCSVINGVVFIHWENGSWTIREEVSEQTIDTADNESRFKYLVD